jgi:hypothetical protein
VQPLELSAYQALRAGAKVLEADRYGDKVLHLPDGTFLKLFRRKRLISSAALFPYAARFEKACQALAARNIPSPTVIGVFRVAEIQRDMVHYHPLPGQTLRDWVKHHPPGPETDALRRQFNLFVRSLHNAGLYFRSLHLGNVVLTPEGRLGLIDISDLRVHRRPLNRFWRKRNLLRMQDIDGERDWLDEALILDTASKKD